MKKAAIITIVFMLFCATLHAYKMKNPTNRFDVALADGQSITPTLQVQGTFNMNEGFYVGLRYTAGGGAYYYSEADYSSHKAYLLDLSCAAVILGIQFGAFNERFNCFFNAMPGYAFGTRKTGTRIVETIYMNELSTVTSTDDASFFAPAVEIGFNCRLTENIILSTGWQITLLSVSDMAWEHYPWLIKTSDENALYFSIPVRLTWRFQ